MVTDMRIPKMISRARFLGVLGFPFDKKARGTHVGNHAPCSCTCYVVRYTQGDALARMTWSLRKRAAIPTVRKPFGIVETSRRFSPVRPRRGHTSFVNEPPRAQARLIFSAACRLPLVCVPLGEFVDEKDEAIFVYACNAAMVGYAFDGLKPALQPMAAHAGYDIGYGAGEPRACRSDTSDLPMPAASSIANPAAS